jgi:hypothetical protein
MADNRPAARTSRPPHGNPRFRPRRSLGQTLAQPRSLTEQTREITQPCLRPIAHSRNPANPIENINALPQLVTPKRPPMRRGSSRHPHKLQGRVPTAGKHVPEQGSPSATHRIAERPAGVIV